MKIKKLKTINVLIMITLISSMLLSGCSSSKQRMMFGTGGTAGTYYAYGGVLAQYARTYANIKVTAVSTGASKVNIQSIQDGDYQLGFSQSDVMTYAWDGTRAFEEDGATHDFRVLGALYDETIQLITMDDSIKSVSDLKGKSVSIGAPGSGVYFNAIDVLKGAGLTLNDIEPQYQSFDGSKEALKDGQIDAAFIVAGAPTSAVTELATTNGVYFINIDGEVRDAIMSEGSFYESFEIPAGTYPGQDKPISTLTTKAVLLAAATVSDEDIYAITSAIFDHADEIAVENAKGAELSLQTATCISTVPYHPGAAKYYAEHGITVNTEE